MARLWLLVLLLAPAAQAQLMPSPHTTLCYLDVNGDGGRGLVEPIYLQVSCSDVRAGDVRLTHWTYPGGTIVHGLHDDVGPRTTAIPGTYAYFDGDGSGSYNLQDDLFLAFGPIPGPIRPGDIPLNSEGPFEALNGTDTRIGRPLLPTAVAIGSESYQERDGNPGYTTGDTVYLDLDANGQATIGDLRLAAVTPVPSSTSSTMTPSTSMTNESPGPPAEPSGTLTSSDTPRNSTPPISFSLLAAALALAAKRAH